MLETSALYRTLLRDPRAWKETRVELAGEIYGQDRIVSCQTTGALFVGSTLGVGGCYAGQVDLVLLPYGGTIPTMAQINVYARLALGDQVSEWLPDGQYFIDTRSLDGGVLTLHGYDAMLKGEAVYLTEGDVGEWPRPAPQVVEEICRRMGVTLDPRTRLNSAYLVEYPNDYTMREVLGYIGAAHAGNWIITKEGKLRLVRLTDLPRETHYLIDEYGDALLFGEVRILV